MLRAVSLAALLAALAAPAAAQEQLQPHSGIQVEALPLQADLPAQFNATVELFLGVLVCQQDFAVPVTLQATVAGLSPAPAVTVPASVDVPFEREVIGVNYPYNYAGSAVVQVHVAGIAPQRLQNGTLTLAAHYDGQTPGACATTGDIPPASNQTTVGVVAAPLDAMGSSSPLRPDGQSGGVTSGSSSNDAPVLAPAVSAALLVAAAALRRRKPRS